EWWRDNLGAGRVFAITGMPLHPMYSINKIMWLKQNRSNVFLEARKFLCVEDYIVYRLTGETVTDSSLAARTMAFDVVKREWSDEILRAADIDVELLPRVLPSGTMVGKILTKVAEELGFSGDAIVATGGHDQPCGALGAGIVRGGMAMNATGTSDVICPALPIPVLNQAMLDSNYCCYPHAVEDYYCSIGFNLTGGLLLKWYRDVLCHEERELAETKGVDPYDVIMSRMSSGPSDVYVLPHFVGAGTPYLDPDSRGAVLGLTLETGKPELIRAIIDSSNYEMRLNIEHLEHAGIEINEIRAVGGGAKSEKWLQMKADVFGKPITSLQTSEAASLGAAILAGKALGCFESSADAAEGMVRVKKTYEPDAAMHKRYEENYNNYIGVYGTLKEFNGRLAAQQAERR
ncbi:MAG: FGGY family carbohydrate kinase, partial [Armatimonadetes bacterium]|nr:FGGY family carbohydrate kinase [Armatimonadota bacterium]